MDDGVVGAGIGALAALDALALVDVGAAVFKVDGALGADLLTGAGKAVLAVLGDLVLVGGAGMAGVGDDVDQGRLVILLGHGGGVHALGDQVTAVAGAQAQTHGKAHALTGDGALEKGGFPVQGAVAGDDLVGQLVGGLVAVAGVGHPGHLDEDLFTDIRDQRGNSAHGKFLLCVFVIFWGENGCPTPLRGQYTI